MPTPPTLQGTRLERGLLDARRRLNRAYLVSLEDDALLQNFLLEAGIGDQDWHLKPSLGTPESRGAARHWGWETPGGALRGHFLGHWLSAAARETAVTGDPLLGVKLQAVLDGLERCQEENGDGWIWAIPPRFLRRLAEGRPIWAPQYAMHKLLMGLVDVHRDLGDERALRLARNATAPLLEWVRGFDDDAFQRIMEVETGGMLEVWADLLAITGDPVYSELLERYYRRSLFDGLLEGRDVLTNMHANTTIPEVLGAARAYEVTGDERWRRIVEEYWRQAVTARGTFCTGGQTSGEIWTPPFEFAARRGEKTQEHCTVYNMIRLADVLLRWTGELAYADYIERNLVNGILAQQHPRTGMVAYFLPLEGGAAKDWGTPTEDFWCCHGTLVQAHTRHSDLVFYPDEEGVTIAQHVDASTRVTLDGAETAVRVEVLDNAGYVGPDANAGEAGDTRRPTATRVRVEVSGAALRVQVRVPAWIADEPHVAGDTERVGRGEDVLVIEHPGGATSVDFAFPFELRTVPIPDEPGTVAFVEGATVLAGLVDREVALRGSLDDAASLLAPDNERQWTQWLRGYRTIGQSASIRFRPVHEIGDERFSVYFPILPDPTRPEATRPDTTRPDTTSPVREGRSR
ncbi:MULTISPECIES: beta-L-arabinofuranosidase domain-containing protein [unclassified Rathayibacter]|uniref:beta-L-arabinofuranosidase domain-containing protein n=1 Tax=unclassified Rathayibacter TaxID=2609250 RepID=UPI0015E374E2|nr:MULTISPECIES: beta-L-arabinofuranosidase domain-containing protein [unclassified Rathayibacter]